MTSPGVECFQDCFDDVIKSPYFLSASLRCQWTYLRMTDITSSSHHIQEVERDDLFLVFFPNI